MLTVKVQGFHDLSAKEQSSVPDNGSGARYAAYVRVEHSGETLYLETDAMEPEDCGFSRDLSWVPEAIRKAYELGLADASREGSGK